MRNRQVHLDFHTSPDIGGVGSKFSKENFQAALKLGHVDSITVFGKCHHGYCYYPTKLETMHPQLDFDLTGAQIEAAHEIGVKAPVYIPVGWSHLDSENHPEWVCRQKDGTYVGTSGCHYDADPNEPRGYCAWHQLCLNDGTWAKQIYALTEEVCKRYKDLDGLFFDICANGDACWCDECVKGMKELGLDPENDDDAQNYNLTKRQTFMQKCVDVLRRYHPDATIFFNGGANLYKPWYHAYNSHFEMEDMPTAWGGYDKFPMRAKLFKNYGKHYVGMTGKFHLDWGEFGGFRTKEALKYEVAVMALYGAGASIGDHLHPDGEMEMQTYANIGYAYDYLEKIEPYCYGGEYITDIGVYFSGIKGLDDGLSNILLQKHIDYDFITDNDFDKYQVVIFLEKAVLDDEALAKLNDYINHGGKVLIMADALLKDGKFQIDTGLEYIGGPEYDCDYIVSGDTYDDVPSGPMLCTMPGHRTRCLDAEVMAEIMPPYFNRTYGHFCGHKNTPFDKSALRYPAIAKKGNVVYVSHSLPLQYAEYGSMYHRNYFAHALSMLYTSPSFTVRGLGSMGRCTVLHQADAHRYCINMTYASPVRRGCAEIVEDITPVYNIEIELKVNTAIKKVYVALSGEKLNFKQLGNKIVFTVPKLDCHTAIVVEYAV